MIGRIFSILIIVFMMIPIQAHMQQEPIETCDIPQLEEDITSLEEQNMLMVFEVTKPSIFKQWLHKIGGAMATRYTIMQHTIRKKMRQIKGWWRGRTAN